MIIRKIVFLFLALSFIGMDITYAQEGSSGKMFVLENGSLSIFGRHNFNVGSGLIGPGKITTSRIGAKGYVNFADGSSWTGASEGRFVDGYVRVGHAKPFVFPVGQNNKFRPVAISGGANISAAYYDSSPAEITNTIPASAYEEGGSEYTIERVSNREYWDVQGSAKTKITFLWGKNSNVANISSGQLENLTLVGLKDGQWKILPSKVEASIPDVFSKQLASLAGDSGYSSGVISTTEAIVPDDYDFFTLASLTPSTEQAFELNTDLITVYPNPVLHDVYINLNKLPGKAGKVTVHNIYGVKMGESTFDGINNNIQHFSTKHYHNGMYKLTFEVAGKTISKKFIVGRLY